MYEPFSAEFHIVQLNISCFLSVFQWGTTARLLFGKPMDGTVETMLEWSTNDTDVSSKVVDWFKEFIKTGYVCTVLLTFHFIQDLY